MCNDGGRAAADERIDDQVAWERQQLDEPSRQLFRECGWIANTVCMLAWERPGCQCPGQPFVMPEVARIGAAEVPLAFVDDEHDFRRADQVDRRRRVDRAAAVLLEMLPSAQTMVVR